MSEPVGVTEPISVTRSRSRFATSYWRSVGCSPIDDNNASSRSFPRRWACSYLLRSVNHRCDLVLMSSVAVSGLPIAPDDARRAVRNAPAAAAVLLASLALWIVLPVIAAAIKFSLPRPRPSVSVQPAAMPTTEIRST